jgi:hypothetical protein
MVMMGMEGGLKKERRRKTFYQNKYGESIGGADITVLVKSIDRVEY